MQKRIKIKTTGELTEISFTVPSANAESVYKAIRSILELAQSVSRSAVDEDNALYTVEEVIPESSPGFRLRGLRAREGITQKALAERLGIRQHHVSEMEKGSRAIGLDMAKRIGEAYGVSYKVFL